MKAIRLSYAICAIFLMVNAAIEMYQTGFNVDKILIIFAYTSGISWCYTKQRKMKSKEEIEEQKIKLEQVVEDMRQQLKEESGMYMKTIIRRQIVSMEQDISTLNWVLT